MSGEIEDQIDDIVGDEHSPDPTWLHYLVWAIYGAIGVLFGLLLLYVLFIILRTVFLYGLSEVLWSI